jgi:hypothetical protein
MENDGVVDYDSEGKKLVLPSLVGRRLPSREERRERRRARKALMFGKGVSRPSSRAI